MGHIVSTLVDQSSALLMKHGNLYTGGKCATPYTFVNRLNAYLLEIIQQKSCFSKQIMTKMIDNCTSGNAPSTNIKISLDED